MAQEARIAVMGATGSGKSTFVNLVSGSDLVVSNGLKSCTSGVQESQWFTLDDRRVALIDTPGFDDTYRSDTDILESISEYLGIMYGEGVTLAGVIYMYRISDVRMGGTSARSLRIFRRLCGEESLCNVLIVTTMWSGVDQELGEAREQELKSSEDLLKPLLDEGAQLVRHEGTLESAQNILRRLIHNEARALRIQEEVVDEGKSLGDTAAGAELSAQLMGHINRLEGEIRKLREEISQLVEKDEKTRKELHTELQKVESKKRRIEKDNKRLKKDDDAGQQLALMMAAVHMAAIMAEKQKPKGWFDWWS